MQALWISGLLKWHNWHLRNNPNCSTALNITLLFEYISSLHDLFTEWNLGLFFHQHCILFSSVLVCSFVWLMILDLWLSTRLSWAPKINWQVSAFGDLNMVDKEQSCHKSLMQFSKRGNWNLLRKEFSVRSILSILWNQGKYKLILKFR